jgi:hypothetical protein
MQVHGSVSMHTPKLFTTRFVVNCEAPLEVERDDLGAGGSAARERLVPRGDLQSPLPLWDNISTNKHLAEPALNAVKLERGPGREGIGPVVKERYLVAARSGVVTLAPGVMPLGGHVMALVTFLAANGPEVKP